MSVTRIKTDILCYHADGSIDNKIKCYGKSTDTKPTDVPNATSFYEMDTQKVFMFDEDNKTWLEQ